MSSKLVVLMPLPSELSQNVTSVCHHAQAGITLSSSTDLIHEEEGTLCACCRCLQSHESALVYIYIYTNIYKNCFIQA